MSTVASTRQLVVCALGDEEYGLPIEQVREIVRAETPRPVASDLPWMRGVIGLRGRLIPVHDLATWLGETPGSAGEAPVPPGAKLVIVDTADEPVALLVDDVVEVLTAEASQIEPVPSGSGEIARIGDRLVLLLDVAELGA